MWKGELVRESTKQGNDKVARQMEAAHRTSLAKGEVGIREKKQAPTLAEFAEMRFAPWAKSATSPKTWLDYYRPGLRTISNYKPIASLRLDEITSEHASDFAAWRQSQGLQVSSVNSSLQVLRRILHVADDWGVIEQAPKIKLLPGERHREHVVAQEEEVRYLAGCTGAFGINRDGVGRFGDAPRRVPSTPLGSNLLGKRQKWDSSRDSWEDSGCASASADDA